MTDRPVNGAPAGPFLDDDFELLQLDRELKDARFETQPIGFFKDAAIRLCHNGAALAAAVLILIVDLSYGIIDPRVRMGGGKHD